MDEAREVGQAHAQFHEYAITPTRLPQSLRALRLSVAETRGMQRTHRRVRRTVLLLCGAMDNFALRYRDWRRGIVALLGRFLPRLGPLFGAASFYLNGPDHSAAIWQGAKSPSLSSITAPKIAFRSFASVSNAGLGVSVCSSM